MSNNDFDAFSLPPEPARKVVNSGLSPERLAALEANAAERAQRVSRREDGEGTFLPHNKLELPDGFADLPPEMVAEIEKSAAERALRVAERLQGHTPLAPSLRERVCQQEENRDNQIGR